MPNNLTIIYLLQIKNTFPTAKCVVSMANHFIGSEMKLTSVQHKPQKDTQAQIGGRRSKQWHK